MPDTKKRIGERIKALRRRAGLTQAQLAELAGLETNHLSRLEVGRNFPSLESLERIASVLEVPLVEFFQFPDLETTASLRAFLTKFAKQADETQLRLAVKVVKLLAT